MSSSFLANGYAALNSFALIQVSGEDARDFLHNQFTNDVTRQSDTEARFNGYCSPKGRLLATMLVWTSASNVTLMLPRELAPSIQKRLTMYVLRARVKLELLETAAALNAHFGEPQEAALKAHFGGLPSQSLGVLHQEDATLIRLTDAAAKPLLLSVNADVRVQTGLTVDEATFRWQQVCAGRPWIVAATQERFVPQMVNLDALNAIDFKKGCFPGQEIVARSQYLGKLKRRTRLATVASTEPIVPGTDIFSADRTEAVGLVVNAERRPQSDVTDLLVELPLEVPQSLVLSRRDGLPLMLHDLPYALPDNEVFVRPQLK